MEGNVYTIKISTEQCEESFLKILYFFKICYCYFQHFFSPLYSMGTQLHIHVYIIFSPVVVLCCKCLDLVLSATQQDRIVSALQKQ